MYDKFHGYLAELENSFSKLAALLHKKLVALEKFDLDTLDGILKEEQAFVLYSKSFDTRIADYRKKLGLSGEKLSDIVAELPDAERPRFGAIFHKLTMSLEEVKSLNQKCQGFTQERLYSLDKAIRQLDQSTGAPYAKANADTAPPPRPGEAPRLFTKLV